MVIEDKKSRGAPKRKLSIEIERLWYAGLRTSSGIRRKLIEKGFEPTNQQIHTKMHMLKYSKKTLAVDPCCEETKPTQEQALKAGVNEIINSFRFDLDLVRQKTDNDCMLACLATFSSSSYDDIKLVMHKLKLKLPLSNDGGMQILEHMGYKPILLKTWVWHVPGILTVPSLNFPGFNHVVVWSGNCKKGKVLDPQFCRKNKKAYDTERVLHGNIGWSTFLCDARDENVKYFAGIEIKQLQCQLGEIHEM